MKYYYETEWNNKKGINICRVYQAGWPGHVAVFYREDLAKEYVDLKNLQIGA